MPEDDDVRLWKAAPQPGCASLRGAGIMDHGHVQALPGALDRRGQRQRVVVVALHRVERGNGGEPPQQRFLQHVASVDDDIYPGEKLVRLGGQVARTPRNVRICQNPNVHSLKDMSAEIGVGLLGLGTVGSAVAEVLVSREAEITAEAGLPVRLRRVLVRDKGKRRAFHLEPDLLTTSAADVLDDPSVNLVIEVMGGEEPAGSLIERAFRAGKHVVTANKELVAKRGRALLQVARETNVDFHYEASVGGGIPLIGPFKQDLVANRISQVRAIINGTTNYMLTRMAEEPVDYADVLAEAQRLGYAEPDPTNDVEGIDASYKLAILATLAFHVEVRPDQVYREGVTRLTARDMQYARELGYVVKLLAIASDGGAGIEARVHPALLEKHALLARVDGVYNAVQVEGDLTGRVMFTGRGAGAMPTASAVVADVIDIAQDCQREFGVITPTIRFDDAKRVLSMDDVHTRYYVRLEVDDAPGVLAQITRVLGDQAISIASIIQREVNSAARSAEIVIVSHRAVERSMQAALAQLGVLAAVREVAAVIRIEEEEE